VCVCVHIMTSKSCVCQTQSHTDHIQTYTQSSTSKDYAYTCINTLSCSYPYKWSFSAPPITPPPHSPGAKTHRATATHTQTQTYGQGTTLLFTIMSSQLCALAHPHISQSPPIPSLPRTTHTHIHLQTYTHTQEQKTKQWQLSRPTSTKVICFRRLVNLCVP